MLHPFQRIVVALLLCLLVPFALFLSMSNRNNNRRKSGGAMALSVMATDRIVIAKQFSVS
jgi:hypothetical protein